MVASMDPARLPTGHVFRMERKRGPAWYWYAKYRLPDGRQIQKKLGPAWTDRGRPAAAASLSSRCMHPCRSWRNVTPSLPSSWR